jgi:hypothetical protein
MPNTEKDFQLILAEKLVDDMNRFMKDNKMEIPKEFLELAKSYKKDGKVTFKDQPALKEFSDQLFNMSFPHTKTRGVMLQSAGVIKNLAENNINQLESTLNSLTTQISAQSPQFYNKDNAAPTAPPTSEQELKEWQQKMSVRTGFSKMFHEHIKHIPGKLIESVQEIMKSSKAKSAQRAKAAKKEVKQPSKKKLAQAEKRALKTPGFQKKSRDIFR